MKRITKIEPTRSKEVHKTKVAAYCRVSTGSDEQLESLKAQRSHYEDYIKEHDDWEFAGLYYDEGITGTKKELRADLLRMLEDCREGKIEFILTKSISRFSRNKIDCLSMVRELLGLGIGIYFEKENINTKTMNDEFLLTILSSIAEAESQSISSNEKWGIKKRMQAGTFKQGMAPYGYDTKKREQFNQMVQDAKDGKIDMIITKSISRFARNTLDCLKTVRKLKEKNVPVFFEKENINTMDASGELLLTIMSSIAQQESESLSKNVKIGLQYRFQQGKMSLNYNRFLGYTRDEEGRLVIVPEEAETVKRIYREYLEGGSTTGIAAGLEADGILTGANRKKWYGTTVDKILRNEKYIGDAVLQKTCTVDFLEKKRAKNDGLLPQYYVEGSHEAIISDQIFMEVQAEIARRAALRTDTKEKSAYVSKYAFSGIVFCGDCGSPYRRLTWKPHGKKMFVWRCRQRVSKGVDSCQGRTIHEEVLEEAVVQAIRQTICNPEAEYAAIETEMLEELSAGHEAELAQIEDQLKDLQVKVVKNVNNNDEFDSLVDQIEELRNRKEELAQEQALDNRNVECIAALRYAIESGKDEALAYSDKLVRDFIDKIEVFPDTLRITMKAGVTTSVRM